MNFDALPVGHPAASSGIVCAEAGRQSEANALRESDELLSLNATTMRASRKGWLVCAALAGQLIAEIFFFLFLLFIFQRVAATESRLFAAICFFCNKESKRSL